MLKYNTIEEYLNEKKRVESIIANTHSYKLRNDMTKYLKRLDKEMNILKGEK
jgi:hypothetical protein